MKKIISILVLQALIGTGLAIAQDTKAFHITGKITELKENSKVYLIHYIDEQMLRDTTTVRNGKFSFKGIVPEVVMGILSTDKEQQVFNLGPGNLSVNGTHMVTAKITGTQAQDDLNLLKGKLKESRLQDQALQKEFLATTDPTKRKAILERSMKVKMIGYQIETDFIAQNPDSYVSLNLLIGRSNPMSEPPKIAQQYDKLSNRLKSTPAGTKLGLLLAQALTISVGKPAKEIIQSDTSGKVLKLSKLRGKYILLDFWASWCGGCRVANRELVKYYDKLKKMNFEAFGVSLDTKKDLWISAMKQDGLLWPQVCDLKGNQNQAKIDYGIYGVPQNFLIDPNGIIIGRNLDIENIVKLVEQSGSR